MTGPGKLGLFLEGKSHFTLGLRTGMPSRNDLLVRALRKFEFLAGARASTIDDLSIRVGSRRVARGVCLWRTGMRADQVIMIQSGTVALRSSSGGAGRAVFSFVGAGEVAGAEFASRWGVYGANAVVSSERVDLLFFDTPLLVQMARTDDGLRRSLDSFAQGNDVLRAKMRVLQAGGPSNRLAAVVASLVERFGQPELGGQMRVPNAPSLPDLAAYAGVSAEIATAQFGEWATLGIARLEQGGILVEAPPSMEALAWGKGSAGACSSARSSGVVRRSALLGEAGRVRRQG
jgi:CRP-like cAMP-binding protein